MLPAQSPPRRPEVPSPLMAGRWLSVARFAHQSGEKCSDLDVIGAIDDRGQANNDEAEAKSAHRRPCFKPRAERRVLGQCEQVSNWCLQNIDAV